MCSKITLRLPRRSASWTFVAPERPAERRMKTTTATLSSSGVRQFPQHNALTSANAEAAATITGSGESGAVRARGL